MTSVRELFREFGNLFRWWVMVAPWEQAVRVRMGKHVRVLQAGAHLRIPFVDRVFRQTIRRRYATVPTQTITTRDGRTVTVSGTIGYEIHDVGRLYDTLHHAQEALQSEAQGIVARFIAARDYEDCQPDAIEEHVPKAMDLGRYGMGGLELFVTDYAAPLTVRLIQGAPKDWVDGDSLNTTHEDGHGPE